VKRRVLLTTTAYPPSIGCVQAHVAELRARVKTYEAIVKGESILEPGVPESFKVLVKELQSLALSVEVLNEDEEEVHFADEAGLDQIPNLDVNITGFEKGD